MTMFTQQKRLVQCWIRNFRNGKVDPKFNQVWHGSSLDLLGSHGFLVHENLLFLTFTSHLLWYNKSLLFSDEGVQDKNRLQLLVRSFLFYPPQTTVRSCYNTTSSKCLLNVILFHPWKSCFHLWIRFSFAVIFGTSRVFAAHNAGND